MPLWVLGFITGGKNFFAALWAFFSKPPGIYVLAIILAVLLLWWVNDRAYNRGEAACEARHQLASKDEVIRQATEGAGAANASENRTGDAKDTDNHNRGTVQNAKQSARDLPPAPAICPPAVPGIIADRLRLIH